MVDGEGELLGVEATPNAVKSGLTRGPEAFEDFVVARQHRLLRSAFLITGDLDLAQDLLQDALIKLAVNWSRIHSDPEAYVRTVLYRDAVSWWRRWRRELVTARVPDRGVSDSADELAIRLSFANALARLSPKQRAVLVLRYFEDLSAEAAAEVLGVSVGTVKSHTHVALRRLRDVAPGISGLSGPGEE